VQLSAQIQMEKLKRIGSQLWLKEKKIQEQDDQHRV